jgi:hypothetical protein
MFAHLRKLNLGHHNSIVSPVWLDTKEVSNIQFQLSKMCVCEIFPQEQRFFKTQRKLGYVTKSRQTNHCNSIWESVHSPFARIYIQYVKHHKVAKFKLSLRRVQHTKRQANENVIHLRSSKCGQAKYLYTSEQHLSSITSTIPVI